MFSALRDRQWRLHSSAIPTAPLISSLSCAASAIHPFTSDVQGHSALPFALAFSPSPAQPHLLAVADEDGHLTLLRSDQPSLAQLAPPGRTRLVAHHNAVFDTAFSHAHSDTLATASADQTVRLWDVHRAAAGTGPGAATYRYGGHGGSVKCVVASAWGGGTVWASGGRDGCARVWDSRVAGGGGVACMMAAEAGQRKRGRRPALSASSTVTAVAWLDERLLCTASSSSACARVWDVRFIAKGRQRCVKVLGEDVRAGRQCGVSSMDVDSSGQHLLLSCTNHTLVSYHWPSATTHSTYASHKANFYTRARFSHDSRYIACGSLTGSLHVYRHRPAGLAGRPWGAVRVLAGHEDEAGCVAWGSGGGGGEYVVASCSDDQTVRVWSADRGLAKSEAGEGDDRPGEGEGGEMVDREDEGKTELVLDDWSRESMEDEGEAEDSDKENASQHNSPMCTPPSLLLTPSSASSPSSSSTFHSTSPFPASSSSSSFMSPSPSRAPLADITNAVVESRPAKRARLSAAAADKPLLAFFSPIDHIAASPAFATSASAAPSSSGKGRRGDSRVGRGSSPTLLDFWSLPAERPEDKTEMETE